MDRSAWYALKLRHQLGSGRGGRVAAALNGEKTMGDLLAEGFTVAELRDYLIFEIRAGLRFPGCGWVLRDLVWEKQHAARP